MKKLIAAALGATCVLVGTVASGGAFAQTYDNPHYEFKVVDSDSDGYVTLNEAWAKAPDVTFGEWISADSDGDHKLNADEFAIAMRAYQRKHR